MSVNFVNPNAELILEQDPFKRIELAGRTCYKSEAAITEESSKKFVKNLIKNQHMAMVEHGYLVMTIDSYADELESILKYLSYVCSRKFKNVSVTPETNRILVSTNIRAILENEVSDPIYRCLVKSYPEFKDDSERKELFPNATASIVRIEDLKDLTFQEFINHFFFTVRFTTDRGVSHEIVRHRLFSFAQESTRYCNYSKDKFGGHLTFCRPSTYDRWSDAQKTSFEYMLSSIDTVYNALTTDADNPLQPQQARAILPNCLKTEIVVSGPAYEWKHFFDLRSTGTTGTPHPDIKVVADMAREKINDYIKSLNFTENFAF